MNVLSYATNYYKILAWNRSFQLRGPGSFESAVPSKLQTKGRANWRLMRKVKASGFQLSVFTNTSFETFALSRELLCLLMRWQPKKRFLPWASSEFCCFSLLPLGMKHEIRWVTCSYFKDKGPTRGGAQIFLMASKSWHYCRTKRALALVKTGRVTTIL